MAEKTNSILQGQDTENTNEAVGTEMPLETLPADTEGGPAGTGGETEEEMDEEENTEEDGSDEGDEEKKESWQEYFRRRMREDGSYVMPNIAWYLAENIFRAKGAQAVPYAPTGSVIKLPAPCLNIWALKDPSRSLEHILKLTGKDIERVAYFACYIVTEGAAGTLKPGTVLSEAQYKDALEKYGNAFSAGIGTEGLLEYANGIGEDISPKVIRSFPVIFPSRTNIGHVSIKERRFHAELVDDLSYAYIRILSRACRIKRLMSLDAPEIILRNEKRMLQETVDQSIQNGLRGRELLARNGGPLFSWAELIKEG